ncbi:MAG: DUF1003 domain-containing protein [Cyclobacteriaceae bacterium]|nr:DUF1003 domain-containing protein [Cyclobacteriaceae bacterium]
MKKSIAEESLILENLLHPPEEVLTRGQTLSDKLACFGGSWKFITWFGILLASWIFANSILPPPFRFDSYPFIFLNLLLSCIAALQAPVIMMSQNRKEEKDRKRSENDYLINLKAELEVRSLHQKMDLLLQEQLRILFENQTRQWEMLRTIENLLNKKNRD